MRAVVTLSRAAGPHGADPGWGSTPCTGWPLSSRALEPLRPAPRRPRRLRVHRAAPGRGLDGGVAGNVVPDQADGHHQLPLRPRPRPRRGRARRSANCWTTCSTPRRGTRSRSSTPRSGRPPALDHPLLARARAGHAGPTPGQAGVDRRGHRSAQLGVPATNFGPGDPLLAHTPDEHVSRRARPARDVLAAVLRADDVHSPTRSGVAPSSVSEGECSTASPVHSGGLTTIRGGAGR